MDKFNGSHFYSVTWIEKWVLIEHVKKGLITSHKNQNFITGKILENEVFKGLG